MLKRMLDALENAAGTHWRQPKHTRRYRVGPNVSHDYVTYRNDGLFRAESRLAADMLSRAHLTVQEAVIRQGLFSYRSLRTGHMQAFRVLHLELLRPLDPTLERVEIGKLKDPEFATLPEGLISNKPGTSGYAVLTHEACDAIRLFNTLIESRR